MKMYASMQSERGLQHEVANAQTLPCLGERRLEVWTEVAESANAMAVLVADHGLFPSMGLDARTELASPLRLDARRPRRPGDQVRKEADHTLKLCRLDRLDSPG